MIFGYEYIHIQARLAKSPHDVTEQQNVETKFWYGSKTHVKHLVLQSKYLNMITNYDSRTLIPSTWSHPQKSKSHIWWPIKPNGNILLVFKELTYCETTVFQ